MNEEPQLRPENIVTSPTRERDYFVRHEHGDDRIPLDEARRAPRFPIIGILDNLRSAHNVGAAFRTGDGANISELWLCGISPTPPHRHLFKTALGSVDSVPWRHFETIEDAILEARNQGFQILGLELTSSSEPLWNADLKFPLALVAGNEVDGLSDEILELCDQTVHLPMFGHKNSLNVSVAFGIALYEILRQHQQQMAPRLP